MSLHIAVLPGDGIGPEVVDAALRVMDAALASSGLAVRYSHLLVGGAAIDAYGSPLRDEDLEICRAADAVLLGAVGGPRWEDLPVGLRPERGLLRLRAGLGLSVNLRPVRWTEAGETVSPLKSTVARGADILFVRELTGGVYFGTPSFTEGAPPHRVAVDTARYSEGQIATVMDVAFELARARSGRVTSVDKANVMQTSHLWRKVATDYAARHPDVVLEHALVDSFAMSLVQEPRRYDVVVTENLFGDILTDLAGVITGSLGLLPSASLLPGRGPRFGLYEPVHGSAPAIAGQGIANPVGCILSVALLLEWSLGRPDLAEAIRAAVDSSLARGYKTADLAPAGGPVAGTQEYTTAVLDALQEEGNLCGDRTLRHHVA